MIKTRRIAKPTSAILELLDLINKSKKPHIEAMAKARNPTMP
jgi:hypothetical protein